MKDFKVAILLATFNGELFLKTQISSIFSQNFKNWHLFIRDDGSTDRTINIIKDLENSCNKVTLLLDEKYGPTGSPAINFFRQLNLINLSDYDYVAFCDQDDIWMPDKIERAIHLIADSNYEGYSSDLIAFDLNKKKSYYMKKSGPIKGFDYLFQGASAGCTYLISSELAKLINSKVSSLLCNYPKTVSHDWICYAICRSYGHSWYLDEHASLFYRQHSINAYGAKPGILGKFSRLKIANNGWYFKHVLLYKDILNLSKDEIEILDAIQRFHLKDRIWLVMRSNLFRRQWSEALQLALFFIFSNKKHLSNRN